ncbi:MAG TPA: amidohydrolase family protein [Fimbriimonadaceae bacterium]
MIERPYAVVLNGTLQLGLELIIEAGQIVKIRPHTGLPGAYVLSAAFVNAHSHLEYRGLQDMLKAEEYFPWIREITEAKRSQMKEQVMADCELAAQENHKTGIARIGEHSDRPFSAVALRDAGIDGILFQELITFFERDSASDKIASVKQRLQKQAAVFPGESYLAPHTAYTVDATTLKTFKEGPPFSIHVAESKFENELFQSGTGPIADFYRANNMEPIVPGKTVVQTLQDWGLTREGAQFVHCCSINSEDVKILAASKVKVAHCPRSNARLKCEPAPVREMLDSGITVGLGLDSAASSGPIDMFAEMRATLSVSTQRGKPTTGEETWRMATCSESLPFQNPEPIWDIYEGSRTPLIKLHLQGALTTDDLIERGKPEHVEWLQTDENSPSPAHLGGERDKRGEV